MAGFAHAGNHDATGATEKYAAGSGEIIAEAPDQCGHCLGLDAQCLASHLDESGGVRGLIHLRQVVDRGSPASYTGIRRPLFGQIVPAVFIAG
jgi:hypothetical protein